MSKVKQAGGVTGERNMKGASTKAPATSAPKKALAATKALTKAPVKRGAVGKKKSSAPTRARSTAPMKKAAKSSRTNGTSAKKKAVASGVKGKRSKIGRMRKKGRLLLVRGRVAVSEAPVVTVAVKQLDPLRKCGPNTTVQFLYRVDESVDGRQTAHLVFFDRHGWYCEHGRTCPAVGHAKKHNGRIARVS